MPDNSPEYPDTMRRVLNPERLAALHETGLLNTDAEPAFDRITQLATRVFATPTAAVSLVDFDRQFFKSAVGLPPPIAECRESPLSHSLCQYVVGSSKPLCLSDVSTEAWCASSGAVTEWKTKAYLGVPLYVETAYGRQVIGAFCLLDTVPRAWAKTDISLLEDFAALVETEIRLRHAATESAAQAQAARIALEAQKQSERSLLSLTRELSRSNEALQEFAFVAAHDLREPLRKVLTFGDRLQKRCGNAIDAEGMDYLARMLSASARMQSLLNDLLLYGRVSGKAQSFVFTDLGKIARAVVEDLEESLHQTGGTVAIDLLPEIQADPAQMRQLLQNVISNALKFHRPGVPPHVRVFSDATITNATRAETGEENPRLCRIIIQDNGIGFDNQYASRIFEVFERLHSHADYEGTGIGLAICRKIVHRHGGEIFAESSPGQGAKIVITLPMQQAEQAAAFLATPSILETAPIGAKGHAA